MLYFAMKDLTIEGILYRKGGEIPPEVVHALPKLTALIKADFIRQVPKEA